MSALKVVLIADDLTGSLDSIAPFAAFGLNCVAAASLDALDPAIALEPEVLSVNLGTRDLPPEQAGIRVTAATRTLMEAAGPETTWIKKIDSRLKGPIAAEISGMFNVLQPERVLLCPAIPELGRTVSQGLLQGHGVTEALHVADMVALDLPCDIPDATSDADLDRLAVSVEPGTLIAAARGLASALARRICHGCLPSSARIKPGPIGFLVGSRDPVTIAQVALMRNIGGPKFITAPDGDVMPFEGSGPFVIQATMGPGAGGRVVAARLAEGVIRHVLDLRTLLLTGGETAAAVLKALGISLLRVEGEVLPGLPLCRALDLPGIPDLVTKSGGFGEPDTLQRLWQAAQITKDTHDRIQGA